MKNNWVFQQTDRMRGKLRAVRKVPSAADDELNETVLGEYLGGPMPPEVRLRRAAHAAKEDEEKKSAEQFEPLDTRRVANPPFRRAPFSDPADQTVLMERAADAPISEKVKYRREKYAADASAAAMMSREKGTAARARDIMRAQRQGRARAAAVDNAIEAMSMNAPGTAVKPKKLLGGGGGGTRRKRSSRQKRLRKSVKSRRQKRLK